MSMAFNWRLRCQTLRFMSKELSSYKHAKISMSKTLRNTTPEAYCTLREVLVKQDRAQAFGYNVQLNEKETAANEVIMKQKLRELEKGFLDPAKFAPGHHIFEVLKEVEKSKLFAMLKTMPKGGILHAHDTALCSTEFLIRLTYRPDLWICTTDEGCKAIAFRFSKEQPTMKALSDCNWEPMCEFRQRRGEENVTKYLYRRFSMYPYASFASNNEAWNHFMGIFMLLDGLLMHAPVWADYYYNALQELKADGVQYLELRSLLPDLYCIDGQQLKINETLGIYKTQTDAFLQQNPDFIGAKLIYAPLRGVEPQVVEEYVQKCTALKQEFGDFLVGFDLVGQEELGRPLIDFIEPLLKMPEDINFYFHAGETNWFGTSIDENLIDAILLGTKRIGHGFALVKHPFAMELCKSLNIAVEVCPVSNQVLQLGRDYRNHPAATLIAQSVPIVISSDDPSFWRASPLTHDFYFAFLGIAPARANLKFLKLLALNSISYSGLSPEEKSVAMQKWQAQWDKWIDNIVQQ